MFSLVDNQLFGGIEGRGALITRDFDVVAPVAKLRGNVSESLVFAATFAGRVLFATIRAHVTRRSLLLL